MRLFTECVKSKFNDQIGRRSLVVPSEWRKLVLSLAHESPLTGHFSHRKTGIRVQEHFYWPGTSVDIKDFCKSCDLCQRMSVKGKVPLVKMPIMTTFLQSCHRYSRSLKSRVIGRTSIYPYFDRSCNRVPRSLATQRNRFRLDGISTITYILSSRHST